MGLWRGLGRARAWAASSSGTDLADGRWYHAAVVLEEGRGVHLYLEGELKDTAGSGVSDFTGSAGRWSDLHFIR
jgi:hypothetical protein